MREMVIVGCGRSKVWHDRPESGPTRARDVYVSTLARLSMEYAEALGVPWYILSAKYGLMSPDFVIPGPYEVTFMDESTGPVKAEVMVRQLEDIGVEDVDRVILLAGPEYFLRLRIALSYVGYVGDVVCPMKRLRIGERNRWLKRQLARLEDERAGRRLPSFDLGIPMPPVRRRGEKSGE